MRKLPPSQRMRKEIEEILKGVPEDLDDRDVLEETIRKGGKVYRKGFGVFGQTEERAWFRGKGLKNLSEFLFTGINGLYPNSWLSSVKPYFRTASRGS